MSHYTKTSYIIIPSNHSTQYRKSTLKAAKKLALKLGVNSEIETYHQKSESKLKGFKGARKGNFLSYYCWKSGMKKYCVNKKGRFSKEVAW